MWGVGGANFFLGIDRLSLRSMGRKGCLFGVAILVVACVALWAAVRWFAFYGFMVWAAVTLSAAWISIGRFEKKNRARGTALQQEIRRSTVDDSDFRLGVDSSLPDTESSRLRDSPFGFAPSDGDGRRANLDNQRKQDRP